MHAGGIVMMSHLLPVLPEVLVVGGGKHCIIRNELGLGCKEGALDALHFYEDASRTQLTGIGLAHNS